MPSSHLCVSSRLMHRSHTSLVPSLRDLRFSDCAWVPSEGKTSHPLVLSHCLSPVSQTGDDENGGSLRKKSKVPVTQAPELGDNFAPSSSRGHLTMSGASFGCHNSGARRGPRIYQAKARDAMTILRCTGPQRILWLQMSTTPRLRNLLEAHLFV